MTGDRTVLTLVEILSRLDRRRGRLFSGVGLIVYRRLHSLPVTPLRPVPPPGVPSSGVDNIVDVLLRHADARSIYHDGFHLLSLDGRLTHVAQYFSPPIVSGLPDVDGDGFYGGRHRAAQYGSCLADVVACGVLSRNYGPIVFHDGARVPIPPLTGRASASPGTAGRRRARRR